MATSLAALPPRYSIAEPEGHRVTVSRPLSAPIWRSLANEDELLLTRNDRDMILRQMPEAVAYVSSRMEPADRDARTIALGRLSGLPAQGVGDGFGKAALEGYHIALGDVPSDLLDAAVERCLKDAKRVFRPSPPELLAYVAPDMAERRRALRRLRTIAERHALPA